MDVLLPPSPGISCFSVCFVRGRLKSGLLNTGELFLLSWLFVLSERKEASTLLVAQKGQVSGIWRRASDTPWGELAALVKALVLWLGQPQTAFKEIGGQVSMFNATLRWNRWSVWMSDHISQVYCLQRPCEALLWCTGAIKRLQLPL